MRHFIQYHNPDLYGPPGQTYPGEPFWVATRKPASHLPGNLVWLILGEGHPRRYSLYEVFIAGWVEVLPDDHFFYKIAGTEGVRFEPPVDVTLYPWFLVMKRSLGNFSLGLTEITHTYAKYLIPLAGIAFSKAGIIARYEHSETNFPAVCSPSSPTGGGCKCSSPPPPSGEKGASIP